MKKKLLAVALVAASAGVASADTVDIDLAGWATFGGYLAPGNSSTTLNIGAGSQVTNIEWINLTFSTVGFSYREELALSVNEVGGVEAFWDDTPAVGLDSSGTFGPSTGAFVNPGLLGSGPFTTVSGNLFVTAYETFNDGGNTTQDASISAGILRITYVAVPAPSAAALVGLGGLVALRRRR